MYSTINQNVSRIDEYTFLPGLHTSAPITNLLICTVILNCHGQSVAMVIERGQGMRGKGCGSSPGNHWQHEQLSYRNMVDDLHGNRVQRPAVVNM